MQALGRAHYRWSCDGWSVSCRASQVFRALEVLKQVCLTRVDLASDQGSVHDVGYYGQSSPRGQLMAPVSIHASRAGRNGSKLYWRQQALEVVAARSGSGSKFWSR
jgi:hypothetical protein